MDLLLHRKMDFCPLGRERLGTTAWSSSYDADARRVRRSDLCPPGRVGEETMADRLLYGNSNVLVVV